MASVAGIGGWSEDPELATDEGRRKHHDRIDQELAGWTAERDADETAALLVAAGVPAAAVVPPRDVDANPQLRARGLFETEQHELTGAHDLPGLPFRFSQVPRWLRSPAPTLGQHNDEVLAGIGLDRSAIARLREAGIVGEQLAMGRSPG